ncbi:MAG: hypothetical protein R3A10_01070 [Caldilineaceae bacterium]
MSSHSRAWLALQQPPHWADDATPVYRLLSPLAGGALSGRGPRADARMRRLAPPSSPTACWSVWGCRNSSSATWKTTVLPQSAVLAYLWLGLRTPGCPLWLAATVLV